MKKVFLFVFCLVLFSFNQSQAQKKNAGVTKPATSKTLIVKTQPNAIVWLDEVRRGYTDENGRIELKSMTNKSHELRVRAKGFRETTITIAPPFRNEVSVKLVQTTDESERLFQEAEEAREKAKVDDERDAAIELYRNSLKLRPNNSAAHVGIARLMMSLGEYEDALEEIKSARKLRPNYAEASVVEGRIYVKMYEEESAVASFQRAIREAKGYQPEALTAWAFIYEENVQYEEAAIQLKAALSQLYDTEPILYVKLGEYYEKLDRFKEAITAYEKYLAVAPNGEQATAIRSFIDQLKRQATEQGGKP